MVSMSGTGRTVLVTGANGYIGGLVARAFQKAGYRTLGLVRSPHSTVELENDSIIPIVGSAANPEPVISAIRSFTSTIDVIVSTTEDTKEYVTHFNESLALFRELARMSGEPGVRPLLLFTSGCKDYGRGGLDGSEDLVMQTEERPIRPPPFLVARATHATKVLDEDVFDATVLRPTHVHGYTSSYLGEFFELAAAAKRDGRALHLPSDPRTIIHSLNVDDCGEAYVALANHPDRSQVGGQCFNISPGRRYETVRDIANALTRVYEIEHEPVYSPPDPALLDQMNPLYSFSQWVGSEKIRNLTGWSDRRPMFAEDLARYREEYERSVRWNDQGV